MPETYRPDWDLATIPDGPLYSEVGRRNSARRVNPRGKTPRCLCGICPLCLKRERMRIARRKQKERIS